MRKIAILAAGGVGSRLGRISDVVPKCLLPVGDIPMLFRWIDFCLAQDYEVIFLNVFHLSAYVKREISEKVSRNKDRILIIEENELSGTLGFLRKCGKSKWMAENSMDALDAILFAHVDVMWSFESGIESRVIGADGAPSSAGCLVVSAVKNFEGKGMVQFDDSTGFILNFEEKPRSWRYPMWANGGILFMSARLFSSCCGEGGTDFFKDAFPNYYEQCCVHTAMQDSLFDIGTLVGYRDALDTYGRASSSKWRKIQQLVLEQGDSV